MIIGQLEKRILEISCKYQLSHIGSSISAVRIIDNIYKVKKKDDIFLLSCSHANLSHIVILEKYLGYNAEELYKSQGVHSTRDEKHDILCSGGHLGQVFACAIGFALSNRFRNVFVLISDGEWYSGIVQEGLNFIHDNNLTNLKLHCNFNGYSALNKTNVEFISEVTLKYVPWAKIWCQDENIYDNLPFLKGLNGHYAKITENDWNKINA
jgi:transketolase